MKFYSEEDKKILDFCIAIIIYLLIVCFTSMIECVLLKFIPDNETADLIASLIEGIIAYAAAILVWYELRSNKENERRQADMSEAEFILNYNQSFIQNSEMYNIEDKLSRWIENRTSKYCYKEDEKQLYINYLVYLESLADLINRDILKLEHIDDLMAYRFFLAMNNPDIQKKELCLYPEYYRNCFKAYAKWLNYRKENNREILLEEYSLDKWYAFEKYAFNIDVCELSKKDDLKIVAALIYKTDKYIYSAAFNSRKNAINIIPGLMNKNGIFNISNYRAAKIGGKIRGIALVIDEPEKAVVPDFINSKCSKSAIDVNEKYFSKIKAIVKDGRNPVYIVCICTDKKFRRQHIGTVLLKDILEKYKERYIILDVLTENYVAVNLYKKYGFKIESIGSDYVYKKPTLKYYKMIRDPINEKRKPITVKVRYKLKQ